MLGLAIGVGTADAIACLARTRPARLPPDCHTSGKDFVAQVGLERV